MHPIDELVVTDTIPLGEKGKSIEKHKGVKRRSDAGRGDKKDSQKRIGKQFV